MDFTIQEDFHEGSEEYDGPTLDQLAKFGQANHIESIQNLGVSRLDI